MVGNEKDVIVSLANVDKTLGGVKRIDDLSIRGERGMIYGLIGPNGAGKTTLLNLITGLYKPDSGTVRIDGLDPVKDYKEVRKRIGLLPQDTALYPELSAKDNLSFHASLYLSDMKSAGKRISEILALVDLSERAKEPVKNFSGGMCRRLGIGKALLNDPKILLLDEPTLGVDVQSAHKIWEYIRKLKDSNKTIFVTTNVMAEADALCDEVIIIDHGKMVCEGSPEKLKSDFGAATIQLVPKIKDTLQEDILKGIVWDFFLDNDKTIIVNAPRGEQDLAEILGRLKGIIEFESVSLHKPTLDDVFLARTGKSLRD
jgi:ABC-type multidrug transport system ATPase subunit